MGRPEAAGPAKGAVRADGQLAAPVAATVALLARALRLDRAALVIAAPDGRRLTPLAVHGDVSDQDWAGNTVREAAWSAVLPLSHTATRGFLLLGRADDEPLSEQDRALAVSVVGSTVFEPPDDAPQVGRAARDRLAHADRLAAIGTLAAGIAHEIRNPLVSVRTFIQLLPERLDDEEFRTSFRDLALSEIERICDLINDLLTFSRPTQEERESTDVAGLIRQTVRLLDAEARKHDVRLVCDTTRATPRVHASEAQLKQVLMNVVLNAIQACGTPGRVTVASRSERHGERSWCVIEVTDTGPGIPEGELGRIFDPFYTTKTLGSGLGLFIARRIIDDHAGTIRTAPGADRGCVFTIRLPADHEDDHGRST